MIIYYWYHLFFEGMIDCGENFDGYEGVYQQFLNGFCGNSSPLVKGCHKGHLEIVVHG